MFERTKALALTGLKGLLVHDLASPVPSFESVALVENTALLASSVEESSEWLFDHTLTGASALLHE